MDHDRFIGLIQARARLSSRGDAERITRATLETLADRLTPDMSEHLAAQLPSEVGLHLKRSDTFERLSLDDFFDRVSEREGADLPQPADLPAATFHARAVLDVVREAVSPGMMEKLQQQFPEDYDRLFAAGSEGKMPGS